MKNLKQKNKKKEQILNQIPIFLAQTYRIVDNPLYSETISWTPDGQSFVIKNVADLTTKIFPQHFKHSNFASFVRQLNMYGFHKLRSNGETQIFQHQYFQKETADLLPFIKRKKGNHSQSIKPQISQQIVAANSILPIVVSNKQKELQGQLNILSEKHEGLQNLVSILVEQNKQIIMQNKNFLNKISKMDETYRRKLQTLIFLMMLGLKNSDGNIIIPQQTHALLKGLRNKKKEKPSPSSSNAIQVFNKESNSKNTFSPKQIQELYKKLISQSEGQISENEEQMQKNNTLSLNKQLSSFELQEGSEIGTPKLSQKSFPNNYYRDECPDFFLDNSDIFNIGKGQQ